MHGNMMQHVHMPCISCLPDVCMPMCPPGEGPSAAVLQAHAAKATTRQAMSLSTPPLAIGGGSQTRLPQMAEYVRLLSPNYQLDQQRRPTIWCKEAPLGSSSGTWHILWCRSLLQGGACMYSAIHSAVCNIYDPNLSCRQGPRSSAAARLLASPAAMCCTHRR